MPITTLYVHNSLHKSLVIAGYVLLGFSGAMTVGNLIGGRLFDNWHQKKTMYLGGATQVLCLCLLTLFPIWPVYPILLVFYGLGLGVLNSAVNGYLAFLQKDDPNIFNNGYWLANIGMALATLLSGLLFDISIRLIFGGSALLFTLTLVLVRFKFQDFTVAKFSTKTMTGTVRTSLANKLGIFVVCLTMIVIWMCYEQWNSNVSVLMTSQGISVSRYSMLFTISTLEIIALQPFITRLFSNTFRADKLKVALGVLVFACSYLILVNAHEYWQFVAGITFVSLGEILALTAIPMLLNRYANDHDRGTIQSLGSLSGSLGRALGPLTGGWLITALGYDKTFLIFFFAHVVVALTLGWVRMPQLTGNKSMEG
uniref:Major facilitator superfamily permease n=1 Tax=Ligilactobacillus pobuzihii TaxID=449659 RepID=A0A0R2LFH9_9LACO|nr:MFS transporter [Ligilactobacillus pobuzihii]KRK09868.1 major facilitator superfamily permease [Ligilactobacillus pobuzihii E100301 = KCTC 13174]KRO00648.1 major facilitator superfamily permease [Ligilactobacillus pobuzihii]GEN48601.1 MFS transporter [Ligilactobacillus pobuzihii]